MTVGVVTDSAASLGEAEAAAAGVEVVAMKLVVDGGEVEESAVAREALFGASAEKFETAGPAPADYVAAIERSDDGDGVVVLTVSARMSSTILSARTGAAASGRRVEVLDTETAAGAEGLVVLAAAREAARGVSLDRVVERSREVAGAVRLVAEVGQLAPLVRGGRLAGPLAHLDDLVGIRPVFEFRRGRIRLLRPARSHEAAVETMLARVGEPPVPGARLHVAGLYGRDEAQCAAMVSTLEGRHGAVVASLARFSPVMVAHTGPDVSGLAWWWEPPSDRGDPAEPASVV